MIENTEFLRAIHCLFFLTAHSFEEEILWLDV